VNTLLPIVEFPNCEAKPKISFPFFVGSTHTHRRKAKKER